MARNPILRLTTAKTLKSSKPIPTHISIPHYLNREFI